MTVLHKIILVTGVMVAVSNIIMLLILSMKKNINPRPLKKVLCISMPSMVLLYAILVFVYNDSVGRPLEFIVVTIWSIWFVAKNYYVWRDNSNN